MIRLLLALTILSGASLSYANCKDANFENLEYFNQYEFYKQPGFKQLLDLNLLLQQLFQSGF